MRILVTGSNGFIGKNLISQLNNLKHGAVKNHVLDEVLTIYEYNSTTDSSLLNVYTKDCDFVFHLAGINRPKNQDEFMTGNFGCTSTLLDSLSLNNNRAPILITSSIQAKCDNAYGQSKKASEDLVFLYGKDTGVKVLVYRLPNVFGKWCKPNYNSAVATFCNNIANDLAITVNDRAVNMELVYIDDVINEFILALLGQEHRENEFCFIPTIHKVRLGEIVELLYSFKNSRCDLSVPKLDNPFEKSLYSTYVSYLPKNAFNYYLKMNVDDRGSFTEIIKTKDRGQFSVNILKKGITKGNHWHHTKTEKFVVVHGKGLIQFRKIGTDDIIDYLVTGDKIEVVDIPPGYTHAIINRGDTDLITFMWANECLDYNNPDTYFEEV